MEATTRHRIRKRGILLASVGLAIALGAALASKLLGISDFAFAEWATTAAITLLVEAALWIVVHLGWDVRIRWDAHFIFLPMTAAALLLGLVIHLAPELRVVSLMGWFVALLFVAGVAGFATVMVLSGIMAAIYLTVALALIADGAPLTFAFELLMTTVFLVVSAYAGIVFQRLRRERRELKAMRGQLERLALTDPLTDLPNRRHFEEILRSEVERIRRYGGRCALAMIDVDHFKLYNDALGHLAGDVVLRELSSVMRRHVRLSDVLARYGGEEFALVMVNVSVEEALGAVDRLREIVDEHAFRDEDVLPEGRLTISAGVAACPENATDFDTLVRSADEALYTAKREGRNRVATVAA